jgi:hypothetical protein
MARWKSFIRKPNKKQFKRTVNEELQERDDNLKENWQKYNDDNDVR